MEHNQSKKLENNSKTEIKDNEYLCRNSYIDKNNQEIEVKEIINTDLVNEIINQQIESASVNKFNSIQYIQIEGSHTTHTETEEPDKQNGNSNNKHIVQLLDVSAKSSSDTLTESEYDTDEKSKTQTINNFLSIPRKLWSTGDVTSINLKPLDMEKVKLQQKCTQLELQQIERENVEIAQRFKKIMEMFDNFTKNLETLESQTSISTKISKKSLPEKFMKTSHTIKKQCQDISETNIHMTKDVDLQDDKNIQLEILKKDNDIESIKNKMELDNTFVLIHPSEQRDVGITVNFPEITFKTDNFKSLSCQTSWHDNEVATIDFSHENNSASSSRSEIPHSLNNFTGAEAAIAPDSQTQINNITEYNLVNPLSNSQVKTPLKVQPDITMLTSVIREQPSSHSCHATVQMEVLSSHNSIIARRRPSICKRICSAISNFFIAICLCLQVNRDCIFCLGFFAAFVVTASFLTAFFYRTLSVSSPLFSPMLRATQGHDSSFITENFNGHFRQRRHI